MGRVGRAVKQVPQGEYVVCGVCVCVLSPFLALAWDRAVCGVLQVSGWPLFLSTACQTHSYRKDVVMHSPVLPSVRLSEKAKAVDAARL